MTFPHSRSLYQKLKRKYSGVVVLGYSKYPIPSICRYCEGEVILTTNDFIYDRKIWKHDNCNVYACIACKASVGTHPDGITPLGLLADKGLKNLRSQAHRLFDPLWKSGKRTRNQAYKWMAKRLGIPVKECHFGQLDNDVLTRAVEILSKLK